MHPIEQIIRDTGILGYDIQHVIRELEEQRDESSETEDIAHILWSYGGQHQHTDCPYANELGEGDYECRCGTCWDWLMVRADLLLKEMQKT